MLSIMLIANTGLFIQCGNKTILLDGLEDAQKYPFSSTPENVLKEMFQNKGVGRLKNIDYLVFTHNHPDHFSKELIKKYMLKNQVKKLIFAPDSESEDLVCDARENKVSVWKAEMSRGKIHHYILGGGIQISTLCMKHIPYIFPEDLCNCILLQYEDKNILFLSDCSYEEEYLFQKFKDIKLNVVFLNPYFYYSDSGRKILDRYLLPDLTVIYHIPFEDDDTIHMRPFVFQMVKKFKRENVCVLDTPFQSIDI